VLTELRKDGFGAQPCFQCIVAEQLIDGQPSNMHRFTHLYSSNDSKIKTVKTRNKN